MQGRGRVIPVAAAGIDRVETYTTAYASMADARCNSRDTTTAVAARPDLRQLVRIHRSAGVSISRIRKLPPHENRQRRVTPQAGTRLRLSGTFRNGVMARGGGVL